MTKIVETVHIAQKPDAVWREIGNLGTLDEWNPRVAKVESEGKREGCLRTVEARDGNWQVERLLEARPEDRTYRYRMESTALSVRDYVGELSVRGDGESTIVWSAEFEPTDGGASAVGPIRSFLRAGLDHLTALHTRSSVGRDLWLLWGAREHSSYGGKRRRIAATDIGLLLLGAQELRSETLPTGSSASRDGADNRLERLE